jgi:hypothetical protein
LEWEPRERDAWVKDAERWICQIQGVLQCKIDLDDEGEVTGVHVVSGMDRDPRHLVRDVEGLLKARLGLDVYYKKIGIVQVVDSDAEEAENEPEPPGGGGAETVPFPGLAPTSAVLLEEVPSPRIQCNGVGVLASERSMRAEVNLQAGLVEVRGVHEGPNHPDSDIAVVGQATVAAVSQLVEDPILLNLSDVRLAEMAGQPVVLAAVELVEGRRSERLYGTCSAKHNRQQAVVYAILDALNRRLAMVSLKSGEV